MKFCIFEIVPVVQFAALRNGKARRLLLHRRYFHTSIIA